MFSTMKRRSAVLVLLIASMAWGCELAPTEPIPTTEPVSTSGPVIVDGAPSNLLGGLLEAGEDLLSTTVRLVGTVVEVVGEVGEALIGPLGGVLSVQDHDLTVPQGAVAHPTLFRMEALEGWTIAVDLLATDPETGENVGEKGFLRPVQLALSYANVDIKRRDIDRLAIARVHEDGTLEVLPSRVDKTKKQVTADLDHFSRYVLCTN